MLSSEKEINFNNSNIGDEGCKYLSESLKSNTTLISLDLRSNNIGEEGCKYLSESLKSNTTLTSLDLNGNNIGFEGYKYLSESLKSNTTLTSLYLNDNKIGEEGCKYLSESLISNTTLTSLGLNDNNIGVEMKEKEIELQKKRKEKDNGIEQNKQEIQKIINEKNQLEKVILQLKEKELLVEKLGEENQKLQKLVEEKDNQIKKSKQKIEEKIQKVKEMHSHPIIEVDEKKPFEFTQPLKEIFVCSVNTCKKELEDAHICDSCTKIFCKKCCRNNNGTLFCPNVSTDDDCALEEVRPNKSIQSRLLKLNVKCSQCELIVERGEFDQHYDSHKSDCCYKKFGCDFVGTRFQICSHQALCEFFFKHQREQKEVFVENLPKHLQEILDTLN